MNLAHSRVDCSPIFSQSSHLCPSGLSRHLKQRVCGSSRPKTLLQTLLQHGLVTVRKPGSSALPPLQSAADMAVACSKFVGSRGGEKVKKKHRIYTLTAKLTENTLTPLKCGMSPMTPMKWWSKSSLETAKKATNFPLVNFA